MTPPTSLHIRPSSAADTPTIAALLSAMLAEMESNGGYTVSSVDDRQNFFTQALETETDETRFRTLVAQSPSARVVGAARAAIVDLPSVFAPRRSLHISAIYAMPAARRCGIGERLVRGLLDWGREHACHEADLNVLNGNPAHTLYERLGFQDVQRKMIRTL